MITQLSEPRDSDILLHHSSSMEESSLLLVEVDIKIKEDIVESCLRGLFAIELLSLGAQ